MATQHPSSSDVLAYERVLDQLMAIQSPTRVAAGVWQPQVLDNTPAFTSINAALATVMEFDARHTLTLTWYRTGHRPAQDESGTSMNPALQKLELVFDASSESVIVTVDEYAVTRTITYSVNYDGEPSPTSPQASRGQCRSMAELNARLCGILTHFLAAPQRIDSIREVRIGGDDYLWDGGDEWRESMG